MHISTTSPSRWGVTSADDTGALTSSTRTWPLTLRSLRLPGRPRLLHRRRVRREHLASSVEALLGLCAAALDEFIGTPLVHLLSACTSPAASPSTSSSARSTARRSASRTATPAPSSHCPWGAYHAVRQRVELEQAVPLRAAPGRPPRLRGLRRPHRVRPPAKQVWSTPVATSHPAHTYAVGFTDYALKQGVIAMAANTGPPTRTTTTRTSCSTAS